ncbi:hypothetical protein [Buttiauxella sp. JUb87]|uniref:hypothetical protein n=1 Tax=Buttiauxella sp. JUb87 TaxID=2485129 RepID=UPI00141527B4|nr:hypothetical protein [Buttiauxella sp. JUb87]
MLVDELWPWQGRRQLTLNPDVNAVYVLKTSLDAAFDETGKQLAPVMARITGNITDF